MDKIRIELKWSILFALIGILWLALERAVGLHDEYIAKHAIYTNFYGIVAVFMYVLALRDKRENYFNGFMSYKQGFMSGCILTLFVAVLSVPSQYVIHTWISPEYFNNAIAEAVRSGQGPGEAEAYFSLSGYMVQAAIGALIMGIITSAIVAFFVKKTSGTAASGTV